MECILLAGGLGTRLRDVVADLPKCMAPVNGIPFLSYILRYLERQHTDHVIFSLGYKSEVVIEWLRNKAFTFKTSWVIEQEPLGTGGGIKLALNKSKEKEVFILNGDTFFDVDLQRMHSAFDRNYKAMVALKPMQQFERYGSVEIDDQNNIVGFKEKKFTESGLINGGIYLLNKAKEDFSSFPGRFSFEQDFLTIQDQHALQGFVSDSYFIDIGVPEDYRRAQAEMKQREN